jgi:hypothetical protein
MQVVSVSIFRFQIWKYATDFDEICCLVSKNCPINWTVVNTRYVYTPILHETQGLFNKFIRYGLLFKNAWNEI